MNPKMTFQDWLNESPEPDKVLNLDYIRRLYQKIDAVYDYKSVPKLKEFLSKVDTQFGMIDINEDLMVSMFRTFSSNLDELKSEDRYSKMFGDDFGRPYNVSKFRVIELRVGDCKTALDQYARFLRGVDSSLAQHAALTRHHYETNYQIQPEEGTNELELPNDWKEMKALINDYQSMQTAMNKDSFRSDHRIDRVRYRRKRFHFTFK